MKLLIIFALVAISIAQCVDVPSFGGPKEGVDPQTRAITPKIIAKAKELGKTEKVEIVNMSENTSTRYNLYKVTLKVDGKPCEMTASEENPVKFLEQPDKNNCILCC